MTNLRNNVALVMIGLSIFVFLNCRYFNGYSETTKVAEVAFTVNFLAIFSVLFMAVGIYLAFLNKRMRRKTRGHDFETTGSRISRRRV